MMDNEEKVVVYCPKGCNQIKVPKSISEVFLALTYGAIRQKAVGCITYLKHNSGQVVDLLKNGGLRYRAALDKLTHPTPLSRCLLIYYPLSK